MIYTIFDGVAAAGLLTGIVSLLVAWRQGWLRARDHRDACKSLDIQNLLHETLREHLERELTECRAEIAEMRENLVDAEKNAQANMDLLRNGSLGMPARSRALRLLRSGVSAETAAGELGLARNEVQLLAKVSVLLSSQN